MLLPKTRGLTEFTSYIDGMARNSRGVATEEITIYLIGNERRGFKHYPEYTDQKTKARTYNLRFAWMMRGTRTQARAVNDMPYAGVAQGEGSKGWMTKMGYKKFNWRNTDQIISTNIKGACLTAERAVVKK